MKLFLSVLFLILCLLTTGCAKNYMERLKDDDQLLADDRLLIKRHVIRIHKDGKRLHPYKNEGQTEKDETAQNEEIIKQIDAFLEKDSSCHPPPEKNILIYVHGGLNHENDALERAVKATKKICAPPEDSAASGVPGNEANTTEKITECTTTYPIFINWRSGPFTTLSDHYFRIRDGEVHDNIALYTSPIYMVGDLAKTIGNTPMAWYHEGYQAISTSARHGRVEDDLDAEQQKYPGSLTKTADDDKSWNVWRKAKWWVTAPIKLITTPFVFTFGTPAWDNMKRRTHTMFTAQNGDNKNLVMPDGAARNFLKLLTQRVKDRRVEKKCPKFELTLMGHSMGGIIINRALRDLPDDLTEVDNLVYMASADNLQNYLDATLPLVKKKNSLMIYNLHLHPENEDREISSGGLTPSGSLLAWIDHTYDTPEYILQRTSGRWSNIRLVFDLIRDKTRPDETKLLENYRFTVFGRGPTEKRPQTHGSFDDFKFWEKSYWTGEKVCWIDDEENNCSKESK